MESSEWEKTEQSSTSFLCVCLFGSKKGAHTCKKIAHKIKTSIICANEMAEKDIVPGEFHSYNSFNSNMVEERK